MSDIELTIRRFLEHDLEAAIANEENIADETTDRITLERANKRRVALTLARSNLRRYLKL